MGLVRPGKSRSKHQTHNRAMTVLAKAIDGNVIADFALRDDHDHQSCNNRADDLGNQIADKIGPISAPINTVEPQNRSQITQG